MTFALSDQVDRLCWQVCLGLCTQAFTVLFEAALLNLQDSSLSIILLDYCDPLMLMIAQMFRILLRYSYVIIIYNFSIFFISINRNSNFKNQIIYALLHMIYQFLSFYNLYSFIFQFIKMNSKGKTLKYKKALNQASTFTQQQKLLKNQTNKIQDKLESLKAQIAMRKTMKNKQKQSQPNLVKATDKNNTATTFNMTNKMSSTRVMIKNQNEKINKFLLGSNPKKTLQIQQVNPDKQKLQNLLQQLKMQQFSQILIQKYSIQNVDKLLTLSEDDIDNWKQIPIGFRIKMKKFISQHIKNIGSSPNKDGETNENQDIEAIIKRRKQQRTYEPINDKKIQQEQEDVLAEEQPQIQIQQNNQNDFQKQQQKVQDQQDILISSLNSAFMINHRKGIIKNSNDKDMIKNENINNKVHWNKNVKQFNKQTSKFMGQKYNTKYPSHQILQKIQHEQQTQINNVKLQNEKSNYCWNCLKKIPSSLSSTYENNELENRRQFCGLNCRQAYKKNLIFEQNQKETQKVVNVSSNPRPQQKVEQKSQSKQQLDILDLSII